MVIDFTGILSKLTGILSNVALVSAIVGAIIGSVMTQLLGTYIAYRKSKKTLRLQLLYQISAFYHEYMSEIEAVHNERSHMISVPESLSYRCPAITKLNGRLMEFQWKVWKSFPQRRIRAAFTKLTNRLIHVSELHLESVPPDLQKSWMACEWAGEMYEALLINMGELCGVILEDKARMVFVRFGKVTEKDLRELSFEDEPVPWEFGFFFPSHIREPCSKNWVEVKEGFTKKFGNLRCSIHGMPTHIIVTESLEDRSGWKFTFKTCCDKFLKELKKKADEEYVPVEEGTPHDVNQHANLTSKKRRKLS